MGSDSRSELFAARRRIGETVRWQAVTWSTQRVAWITMTAAIIAASAGLFGDGPLANAAARSPDGALSIRYESVVRRTRASRWHIHLRPGGTELRIGPLEGATLVDIAPMPVRQARTETDLLLWFAPVEMSGTVVIMTLQPTAAGTLDVRIGDGRAGIRLSILILP